MSSSKAWNCPACKAINVTPVCGCSKPHNTTDTMDALNAIQLTLPIRKARKVSL